MPIEDLLATLPEELLSENAAPMTPSSVDDGDDNDKEEEEEGSDCNLFYPMIGDITSV